MKRTFLPTLLCLLFIGTYQLHAQGTWTLYTTASTSNGLLNNSSNCIFVDAANNKWVGSSSGLSKFDGTTWTNYSTTNGALTANAVNFIKQDAQGKIWVGMSNTTTGGVGVFDGTTWTYYNKANTSNGMPANTVYDMVIDAAGNKWITTGGGLCMFDGTTWTNYTTSNSSIPSNSCRSIIIDATGKKWIGTALNGLISFDGTTWTNYTTSNSGLSGNTINNLLIDPATGKLWVSVGSGGLCVFDGTTWTVYNTTTSGIMDNSIYNVVIDASGKKWIGGNSNGICTFDGTTWTWYNATNTTALAGTAGIARVAIDNTGNIWFGAFNKGVYSLTFPCNAIAGVVSSSGGTTFCGSGNTTLSITGASTSVTYQWKLSTDSLNWTNVATTPTLAGTISGTAYYKCVVKCTSGNMADSTPGLKITVNPTGTPAVSVASNAVNNTVCSGTPVIFTATPAYGGTAPIYVWKKGTTVVGTNSPAYTDNNPNNIDAITVTMTSNDVCATSLTPVTSNGITMTINPTLTPSVSLGATATNNAICEGTPVTFTASPTNGGTPVYVWKKGTVIVGNSTATYIDNALANGDVITVSMTSNAACASTTPVTTTGITMTVDPIVTPSVSVSANTGTTICDNQQVTFTASPVHGGNAPTYTWRNGTTAVATGATYSPATIANNAAISVVLTSNAACTTIPTATSNTLNMTVRTSVVPDVNVVVTPNDTVCAGTAVTFTAIPVNGGIAPTYTWKVGNTTVGGNSAIYIDNTLLNGDVVSLNMLSNATCIDGKPFFNRYTTITVNPLVLPVVTITANPGGTISTGTNVTFTATVANGGPVVTYQWQKNGTNIQGATNTTYTTNTLINNDIITCVVKHSNICATKDTMSSNSIVIKATTNVTLITGAAPDVTLYPNPNTGSFNLTGAVNGDKVRIEVLNAVGQTIYQNIVNTVNGQLNSKIELPSVAAGMYLLRMYAGENASVIRFTIAQ